MACNVLICHVQAQEMEDARIGGQKEMKGSLDLGRTRQFLGLNDQGLLVEGAVLIPWSEIKRVLDHPKGCFVWRGDAFEELYGLSETSGWTYRLVPTLDAPALHLAGFTMHRMDGISPYKGAIEMVHALGSPKGDVLDTAGGLGYAALGLSENARRVLSIELDPAVRELCRQNPWSADIFWRPNIELLLGDSAELIRDMADESFGAVLHDPPSVSLAGELYSAAFYRELYRILKCGGSVFHYIGDPKSAFGSSVTRGVMRRISEAGFVKIEAKPRAFGLLARKEGRFQRGRRGRSGASLARVR